jgi:hypothetical protein
LEVFTRRNLADLIDHNRLFTDRAIELSKNIKIDFALVRDIQGRTITLGDILAHSVPINSLGHIAGCFETVLGKSLRPLLETIVDRWDVSQSDLNIAAGKDLTAAEDCFPTLRHG